MSTNLHAVASHRHVRPRVAEPSHNTMHKRVGLMKGPASAGPCVECGAPASDWSYLGGYPDERIDTSGPYPLAVSSDPDRYVRRCRLCHRVADTIARRGVCLADEARRWLAAYAAEHGPAFVAGHAFDAASREPWAAGVARENLRVVLARARRDLGGQAHRVFPRWGGSVSTWIVPTQQETGVA
jgi:hypothetical protein